MHERPPAPADRWFAARVERSIDRMHDASQNIVGTSAAATTICHDVLESLWERHDDLTDADLTREALLLATRQRSLDHLDRHGWQPPGDGGPSDSHHDTPAVRYRVVLAHAAASVLGAGDTSLVDLHVRHGIDAEALCDELGVSGSVAQLCLTRLSAELGDAVAAFTLWNDARPGCSELAMELGEAAEKAVFGPEVSGPVFGPVEFDVIERHRRTCDGCAHEHRSLVNPAGLFLTARVSPVTRAIRERIMPFATAPVAGWAAATAADATALLTAEDIEAARRPGEDDEIAELWATAAVVEPARRIVPVPSSHRRARPQSMVVLVGAIAVIAAVASGAVYAARSPDGGGRDIVDDTPANELPAPVVEEEPEVRSLGPLPPPTTEMATIPLASTTTAAPDTTPSTEPTSAQPAVPTTTAGTRVATGTPPQAPQATPTTPTPPPTIASSPGTTATPATTAVPAPDTTAPTPDTTEATPTTQTPTTEAPATTAATTTEPPDTTAPN